MRLPLEEWVDDSDLPEASQVAFREAVICFKAGAYRASLLFSYLGWNLAIRYRVLSAHRPEGMAPAKWEQIAELLRDDDKWDSKAFDCTQMTDPAPVFGVSKDLRAQVLYWKDRRNDCAHYKLNRIVSSHVEAFWAFIQSNLGRFVPSGGREDLLQKLERHYDANYTAPGSDVAPLVARIPLAVEQHRYSEFFEDVFERFSEEKKGETVLKEAELSDIFHAALRQSDESLADAARKCVGEELWLLSAILRREPGLVLTWSRDRTTIRRIWREMLFEDGHQDLPVYAALLRNGLIPQGELREANEWIAEHLRAGAPRPDEVSALSAAGFFDSFKKLAFENGKLDIFGWGNRNASFIAWYVEAYRIDDVVARSLCSIFGGTYYPFQACAALAQLISKNARKRRELERAARRLDLNVPAVLTQAVDEAGE